MHTLMLLLTGLLIGTVVTVGVLIASGGWYEYHAPTGGETYRDLVNSDGWEPFEAGALTFFRRPRFRPVH